MTRGLVVSLLGIDGAGKSTMARTVAASIPGARTVYTGLWQRPRPGHRPAIPGTDLLRRLALAWRSGAVAAYHRARGRVVVLDRSPQDALLGIRRGQPWRDRLYFTILARAVAAPDLTIVLDLDGAAAFARKGEHDPAALEAARRDYLRLAARTAGAAVIDARRSVQDVRDAVLAAIAGARLDRGRVGAPRVSDPLRAPAGPSRALRILVITPGVSQPPSDGFSIRVDGLVRELARRHRITLLRFDGPDGLAAVEALGRVGVDVRLVRSSRRAAGLWKWLSVLTWRSYRSRYYHDAAMQRAIDAEIATGDVDVIQLESTELCAYDLGPITGPPIVLDTHNVHGELLRRIAAERRSLPARLYWRLEAAKFAREEQACWRAVDACVMTSERETAIVAAMPGVRRVITVPNAVDLAAFQPEPGPRAGTDAPGSDTAGNGAAEAAAAEIVFTGLLSYRPNEDAVAWFVHEILPRVLRQRPDARFNVVGKEVPAALATLASAQVTFTGYVADVRPYLERATVAVVPLRSGSGTRLKILEAFAMRKAIVSTTLGAEGLDVVSERDLLLADDPDAFAAGILRLMADGDLRARLGQAGRRLVEREQGWPASVARLEALYATL